MTPEQRQQQLEVGTKVAPFFAYSAVVIAPVLMFLASAGALWLMASVILSAGIRFKQVFAVVCYASLTGLISAVFTIVVLHLKNPDEYNVQNPLAFNPAAFMDQSTSSKFLYSLATSLDLFSFWTILLMAVGLKAAAGKKLSFGSAVFAVVLPWAVRARQVGVGWLHELATPACRPPRNSLAGDQSGVRLGTAWPGAFRILAGRAALRPVLPYLSPYAASRAQSAHLACDMEVGTRRLAMYPHALGNVETRGGRAESRRSTQQCVRHEAAIRTAVRRAAGEIPARRESFSPGLPG